MRTFNLSGEVKFGSQKRRFSKEMQANNEGHARELLMVHFGSKHKLPRRFINLLEVSEIKESIVLSEPKDDSETEG